MTAQVKIDFENIIFGRIFYKSLYFIRFSWMTSKQILLLKNSSQIPLSSSGPRTSADGFSSSSRRGCDESPSMSVDNIPPPPPAMFSSSSSSSDHQSNKFLNFGCAECEGQAEHERIKSLLKQKKGKGSGGGGGKHPKVTENPDPENPTTGSSDQEVVWTKSSYSTLPNPRSRGHSLGGREKHQGHPHHPHQDQPGSQV